MNPENKHQKNYKTAQIAGIFIIYLQNFAVKKYFEGYVKRSFAYPSKYFTFFLHLVSGLFIIFSL